MHCLFLSVSKLSALSSTLFLLIITIIQLWFVVLSLPSISLYISLYLLIQCYFALSVYQVSCTELGFIFLIQSVHLWHLVLTLICLPFIVIYIWTCFSHLIWYFLLLYLCFSFFLLSLQVFASLFSCCHFGPYVGLVEFIYFFFLPLFFPLRILSWDSLSSLTFFVLLLVQQFLYFPFNSYFLKHIYLS